MNPINCCKHFLLATVCLASAVTASPLASATSLSDLVGGASLDAGSAQFTDWELVSIDSLSLPLPDLTLIDVVALVDDPANPGVQLVANRELATNGLDNINLVVSFKVSPSLTERLIGQTLDLSDVTFGGGSGIAFVTADIADNVDNPVSSGLVMADKESEFFLSPAESSFAPEAQLKVTWDIFVTGFSTADPVSLDAFTHRFAVAAVPEPSSLLACVTMLAGLASTRQKLANIRRD